MLRIIGIVTTFILFMGCAHSFDVKLGEGGIHKIILTEKAIDDGSEEALYQANHFCEKRNLSAAVVNQQVVYIGSINEKKYIAKRNNIKAAKILNESEYALSGDNDLGIGNTLGATVMAREVLLKDGYKIQLEFKCV